VRFVVVGAGGHGREVLDVVEALNDAGAELEVLGFVARDAGLPDALERRAVAIVGDESTLAGLDCGYNLAIGDPAARHALADRLDPVLHDRAVTLVHPCADVAPSAVLAAGAMVPAGAAVGDGAVLGRHVHLNVNAVVGPRSTLGDFATLSPGSVVGVDAVLGRDVLIGAGATVADGVEIGDGAVVGAGAQVIDDVPAGATVVGRPARVR
jgi:sugar O-acyltransferase (sialic acid O-acetyltransferase NeuD family)